MNAHHAHAAISSITIFELEAGAGILLPDGRKDALEKALARTLPRFGARVYAFDEAAAEAAARRLVKARPQEPR